MKKSLPQPSAEKMMQVLNKHVVPWLMKQEKPVESALKKAK